MISLTRWVIASTLILFGAGFLLRVQLQTKSPRKGSVAGKVTIKGKPADGVLISMRSSESSGMPYESSFKATTDQLGSYRIIDVPAGSYYAFPIAPSFVNIDKNNPRGEIVVVSEGEIVKGVDFALVRGGVITGKVTDADGRALIEQRVSLFTDPPTNQGPSLYPFTAGQTDDRGIYRLFGIAPGRYKIAAGQGNERPYMPGQGQAFYAQTFYPEASDAANATVIEVAEGLEVSNIDISLGRAAQRFAASGILVDGESGKPIGGARFGVQLVSGDQRNSYISVPAVSNSRGEFRIENLPGGKYRVFVMPRPDSDHRSDAVAFDIVDQDVSGLLVKTAKWAASVSGIIVLENTEDKAIFADLLKLEIHGYVQDAASPMNFGHSSAIGPDGSFQMRGLETGKLYLSLGSRDRNLMKRFVVSRIEPAGADSRVIEVKSGDQITGVRVVVTYASGRVSGVVKLVNGDVPAGARIYIRIIKDGETRQTIQSPPVDARGRFLIEGVPGGLYNFETSVFVPGVKGRQRPSVKQQVNVLDAAVTEVEITVDLNDSPGSTMP